MSGSNKLSFTADAGKTYYVEFKPNVGAMFAPSLLAELANGQQTGPFNMLLAGPGDMGSIVPVGCAT